MAIFAPCHLSSKRSGSAEYSARLTVSSAERRASRNQFVLGVRDAFVQAGLVTPTGPRASWSILVRPESITTTSHA